MTVAHARTAAVRRWGSMREISRLHAGTVHPTRTNYSGAYEKHPFVFSIHTYSSAQEVDLDFVYERHHAAGKAMCNVIHRSPRIKSRNDRLVLRKDQSTEYWLVIYVNLVCSPCEEIAISRSFTLSPSPPPPKGMVVLHSA